VPKMDINKRLKQVIVIRMDLNMRKGKMIAQGAHAAMMFALDIILAQDEPSADEVAWIMQGMKKITVRCESEDELLGIERRARDAGLTVHVVTDAGHTEFQGVPTKTCLAIGPNTEDGIDKITKDLRLL
jgi:PTH2 family peptidyl-tRNA hydrolase